MIRSVSFRFLPVHHYNDIPFISTSRLHSPTRSDHEDEEEDEQEEHDGDNDGDNDDADGDNSFSEEGKQLKMLGLLDKKLDEISKRLKPSPHQPQPEQQQPQQQPQQQKQQQQQRQQKQPQQPHQQTKHKERVTSRSSGRVNSRMDSPSRYSHGSSYFNQIGEQIPWSSTSFH